MHGSPVLRKNVAGLVLMVPPVMATPLVVTPLLVLPYGGHQQSPATVFEQVGNGKLPKQTQISNGYIIVRLLARNVTS